MNLLFVTPYLPSESSGHAGAQLIYRNIIALSKIHNLTVVSFEDRNENEMIDKLKVNRIDVHTVFYPRNQKSLIGKINSLIRNFSALLSFLKGNEPFFIAKYDNKNMRSLLSDLIIKNNFDLVQVEYNVMHHYADLFKNIPSIVVFHDISTKLYERGKDLDIKSDQRSYQISKKVEIKIANKFDAVVTLTEQDKLYLRNLGYSKKIYVIPPQVKNVISLPTNKLPNTICFIGSFYRETNIQAVEKLIDEIFLNISVPVELNIAGKGMPKKIKKKIDDLNGINYHGFVADIDEFISKQMLMVAPIELGAGLKMKIPHSLANGTPVITTPVGAEGINIDHKKGLWICKSNSEMIEKINSLLPKNNKLIDRGNKGKSAVNELFSSKVICQKFEKLYSIVTK